jgi:ABC-type enterochelin transport system substrate-binding protein
MLTTKQKKSLIIKQIRAAKSKLLIYLDDNEERLITEVGSVQEKNEEKINREKHEDFFCFSNFLLSSRFSDIFDNVSVILSSSFNVSESKYEFLTSFEAESKGKTDSQDLWLSERQALQKKSLIIKQISAAKSKVPKYLDNVKERLITEVGSVQEKNEEKINREKHEICQLTSVDVVLSLIYIQ